MLEFAGWELILLSALFLIVTSLLVALVFHYRRRLAECRTELSKEIESLRCPKEETPNGRPALFAEKANSGNAAFINKLVLAVGSRLDDSAWFPAGLAREMCLSESQLNRKLKAMTGHTISSFLMWMRLDRARQMLSNGGNGAEGAKGTSIKEVAYTCGFNSLPYFTRSFKNEFGVTPSQFAQDN